MYKIGDNAAVSQSCQENHDQAEFSFDKHPNIPKTQWMLFKERLSQGVVELSELLGNWEPIIFFLIEPRGTSLELIAVNPIF